MSLPTTKREARKWVREHFASYIENADMGLDGDEVNELICEVFTDESQKIANRIRNTR